MKIFDTRVLGTLWPQDVLENIVYFGTTDALICAHPDRPIHSTQKMLRYFSILVHERRKAFIKSGLKVRVALGVTPDVRPTRSHFDLWDRLPEYLQQEHVVALGDIGVWEDDQAQWEMFDVQIAAMQSVQHQMPVIVVVRGRHPVTMTYKMMQRLERLNVSPAQVVFHQAPEPARSTLLSEGFAAALTFGACGDEPRDAVHILDSCVGTGSDTRLMLASSLGAHLQNDVVALPRVIEVLQAQGVDSELVEAIAWRTAHRYFEGSDSSFV